MKRLYNTLFADLRRAFLAPRFLPAVLLLPAVGMLSVSSEMTVSEGPVLYLMVLFVFGGSFSVMFSFIGVIPYGSSFCEDWKNRYIRPTVIRSGRKAYGRSKVLATALSAAVSVTLGLLLTAGLLLLLRPMADGEFAEYGHELYDAGALGVLMDTDPWLYLAARASLYGLGSAFWAVFALWISTYVPDPLVVYGAPVIGYYTVIHMPLPRMLRMNLLLGGRIAVGGALTSYLYTAGILAALTALFGGLFCRRVNRRLADG